jgi:(R,R)-butanediol dehydrogenase/meso-butanediol dehydrogenase/diacetyl reductase
VPGYLVPADRSRSVDTGASSSKRPSTSLLHTEPDTRSRFAGRLSLLVENRRPVGAHATKLTAWAVGYYPVSMLAARWHGNRDVRLEDVELDLELGRGMVEADVRYCGICGSDVAEYAHGPFAIRLRPHALSGQAPPVTLGHEISGRITAVGDDVAGLAPGDRVSVDACWRCGNCPACRAGRYNLCPLGGGIGLCSDGGFASRVRFPAYAAVPLPEAVSDRAGALLEPLAVGLHALERGGARAGDRVVVLGFGPIGATAATLATAMGLTVLVSEPSPARRRRAEALGHRTIALDGSPRDAARAVRNATGGGVELVIDASGVPAALEAAPDMTVRGGTIVVVGLPKRPPEIDAARLVLFERSIVGSLGYANDLPRVASLIAAGHLKPDVLITREVGLEDVPAELARLAADPGSDVKVLVDLGA